MFRTIAISYLFTIFCPNVWARQSMYHVQPMSLMMAVYTNDHRAQSSCFHLQSQQTETEIVSHNNRILFDVYNQLAHVISESMRQGWMKWQKHVSTCSLEALEKVQHEGRDASRQRQGQYFLGHPRTSSVYVKIAKLPSSDMRRLTLAKDVDKCQQADDYSFCPLHTLPSLIIHRSTRRSR